MTHDLESATTGDETPDTTPPVDDTTAALPADEVPSGHIVPGWLAVLVLVLLLAIFGVGGFIVRGLVAEPRQASPEQREIDVRSAELAADPDNIQARLSLGYAYQLAGRYDEALAEYEFVLDLVPTDTAALYNTGMIMFELGRPTEAEEVLWQVLEVNPEHVLAAKALGEHYAEKGHYRSLLEAVRPASQENESSADLQYLMGLAYENLGRADWAEARYRLALQYYPDMADAQDGLERLGVTP